MDPQSANAEAAAAVQFSEIEEVEEGISDHETDMGESLDQRRVLPEELAENVVILTCESSAEGGSCVVYVIGTAHVSQESCREVQELISFLKPEVVFLELCSSRLDILTQEMSTKVPTLKDMLRSLKKKHTPISIIHGWFLAKVASRLEVFPGAEFVVAFAEAVKYGGKVALGDRPIEITMGRTWAKMSLWHKIKFFSLLIFQSLFLPSAAELNRKLKEVNDSDTFTLLVQQMNKLFPTLMETLVHERDQYMSSRLLMVASERSSVVAVVGKGHVRGIKKHWEQPINVEKLMEMPCQKSRITFKRIIIVTLAAGAGAGAIIAGHLLSRKN